MLRSLASLVVAALLVAAPASGQQHAAEPRPAHATALQKWAHAIGVSGYVYGAPLVELSIAEYRQTQGVARDASAPHGLFAYLNGGRLSTDETSWFGAPNPDVLYASAWLNLEDRPTLLYVPPMDDVWYSVQFEDYFMNDVAYLSSRTIGQSGGFYLVVHGDWQAPLPAGVQGVVKLATPVTWVLTRIAASSENQAQRHEQYERRFKFMPLESYLADRKGAAKSRAQAQAGVPKPTPADERSRGSLDAFRLINHQLRANPTPAGEAGLMALFDQAGFGPSVVFDAGKLPTPMRAGLEQAARDGAALVDGLRSRPQLAKNGWSFAPRHLGVYGTDYLLRALSAFGGIGANVPEEAVYPNAFADSDGVPLDGRSAYTIRFPKGALPPAKAFWSIAAYDLATRRLMRNPLGRFGLGSSSGLVAADDGSVTISVSSREPRDPLQHANWLPVQPLPFSLILRIYDPEPAALEGSYEPPAVVRVKN